MTQQIKEFVREYPDFDKETGKDKVLKVKYSVTLKNNLIKDIRNEYGFSIKEGSDCWDFITNNLNN